MQQDKRKLSFQLIISKQHPVIQKLPRHEGATPQCETARLSEVVDFFVLNICYNACHLKPICFCERTMMPAVNSQKRTPQC